MNDGYNFNVRLDITDLYPEEPTVNEEGEVVPPFFKSHMLFPAKTRFETKKSITIKHSKDINIDVFADYPEGASLKLAQFKITNITQIGEKDLYKDAGKPKVHLTF